MSIQNKETLKTYFETNDIPTENHFASLIDSAVTFTPGLTASVQIGTGVNAQEDSIKVGNGLVILGTEPVDPNTVDNGSLWLDSFGVVNIKTGGRVMRLR